MTFYIKFNNSGFVGDLFVDTNLKRIFPTHDWQSGLPPEGWVECEVTPCREPSVYEKFEEIRGKKYFFQMENGKAKQVWNIVNLNDVEKKALQDEVKKKWAEEVTMAGYEDWYFDETYCKYFPPTMPPRDGKVYDWDTVNKNWKEATE